MIKSDYVSRFHFIVKFTINNGGSEVETHLCVFDQKTLSIVQTIVYRSMFGRVGKGNYYVVPVETGTGNAPLDFIKLPIFVKKPGGRYYRRSYAKIQEGCLNRFNLDGATHIGYAEPMDLKNQGSVSFISQG